MEHDLTQEKAKKVRTRFELAVRRMMNAWLAAGRVNVSTADVRLACEFLEYQGCRVESVPGAYYRVSDQGDAAEMTGEDTVLSAMRRLATTEPETE